MQTENWQQLWTLFDQVVELPLAQRDAFIAQHCGTDAELAQALRRMLAADAQAASGDFLEVPLATPLTAQWLDGPTHTAGEYPPGSRQFGPYRLLRLIGQGGMGEVHLAERADGAFEQRVALKLLPHPTPGLMQRFRQERQILAQLEHPHIARLLDGGVGEQNVPYFAMEFVDGQPITRYARERDLDIGQTLQLFLDVCDAVRYAHRNLVVHRDLKPSNILVATDGTAKLLDFGIAKVLQGNASSDATQTGARVFTPDYAAPEQFLGEPVTTATDVYALGVVLYELLAGRRPYTFSDRSISLEQAVLESEPIAPSAAIARGDPETTKRRRGLRGDLDRIVLTALAKEPERRYSSAEALAADIRAYLEGRPVAARGDSAMYRLRKFIRRNRLGVAAASGVVLILIAATGISLRQAEHARESARRAETKSKTAEAVKDYLLSVFSSANPYKTDGKTVTARDLLEGGLDQVEKKLAGQPEVQAEIYASFVETFVELDQLTLADRAGHLALDRYREFLSDDAVEVLRLEQLLAQVQIWGTHFDGVVEKLESLLKRIGDRGGAYAELRGDVLGMLTITHYRSGRLDQAITAGLATLAQMRLIHPQYAYDTDLAMYTLALIRMAQGRPVDAAPLITEFSSHRDKVGPDHPGLITDVTISGRYLQSIGRLREATQLLGDALTARLRQFPENHSFVVRTRALLASAQLDAGDAAGVEKTLAGAIELANATPNFAADDVAEMYFDRGRALVNLQRLDEARNQFESARTHSRRVTDKDAPVPLAIDVALADISRREGHVNECLAAIAPILVRQRERHDRDLTVSLLAFARASITANAPDAATAALTEALNVLSVQGRQTHPLAREVELELAALPQNKNSASAASAHLNRAAAIGCINFGCDDPRVQQIIRSLAAVGSTSAEISVDAIAKLTATIAQSELVRTRTGQDLYLLEQDVIVKATAASKEHKVIAPK
jgi:eukaryotic-like serine/threonine-protein kinase